MCTFADHLIVAVPVAVAVGVGTYLLTRYFSSQSDSKGKVNLEVNKDNAKVVHSFDIEDIGKKAVYCRCWRSKKVGVSECYSVKEESGQETVMRCLFDEYERHVERAQLFIYTTCFI